MEKPQEKRLIPRDAVITGIALLFIAGAVLVFGFLSWGNGARGNQSLKIRSIFAGLVLKYVQLTIREYSAPQETGQMSGLEQVYEDAQTIRGRPVRYLPAPPTPSPQQRISIPTSPAFHESLYEQIRSQLEVAGIPINLQLPPPEEPGKETGGRPPISPPGNGYLRIDIEVEHSPDVVTFQIQCRLYRDMRLPEREDFAFEIPITTPRTPRHRVRRSDFRAALSYEIEQILQNYVTRPYENTINTEGRPNAIPR